MGSGTNAVPEAGAPIPTTRGCTPVTRVWLEQNDLWSLLAEVAESFREAAGFSRFFTENPGARVDRDFGILTQGETVRSDQSLDLSIWKYASGLGADLFAFGFGDTGGAFASSTDDLDEFFVGPNDFSGFGVVDEDETGGGIVDGGRVHVLFVVWLGPIVDDVSAVDPGVAAGGGAKGDLRHVRSLDPWERRIKRLIHAVGDDL
jgi:hypothetical protein